MITITDTISRYRSCTIVLEIRDTKMHESQFLSLINLKSNGGDNCINNTN